MCAMQHSNDDQAALILPREDARYYLDKVQYYTHTMADKKRLVAWDLCTCVREKAAKDKWVLRLEDSPHRTAICRRAAPSRKTRGSIRQGEQEHGRFQRV